MTAAADRRGPQCVLFDYGVGNLHSLRKALQALGADVDVTQAVADLEGAQIAVLPGVGAFGHVMESLRGGEDLLRARHEAGRPILGVCIGMQVLYEASDEAPGAAGLGILSGRVQRLPASAGKIPHMGWNDLQAPAGPLAPHDGGYVYYVHSYAAPPSSETLATSTYGMPFAAAVRAGNTIGFQFHPEKSSDAGRGILRYALDELEAAL